MHQQLVGVFALVTLTLVGCGADSRTGKENSGKNSEAQPKKDSEAQPKPVSKTESKSGSEAEAKWSKEVAQHFLNAFTAANAEAMRAASTKSFAKQINPNIEGGPVVFTITSHDLSPNLEQASVKGLVDFQGVGKRRSFSMLMEKEEGRWKVSSFTQGAPQ